jgi:hypothetical protein
MSRVVTDSQPTSNAEINAVLLELTHRVSDALGDNLVGVYLQGSLAIGDFTAGSDIDFIVLVREDIAESQLPELQSLHASVYGLPNYWAQHLEGSYAPELVFRRWSETPRDPPGHDPRPGDWIDPATGMGPRTYPFHYLDHGARSLVRSEHDNTRVVRWSTREKGVVLVGPPPTDIIDPVTADDLRAEMTDGLTRFAAPMLRDPASMDQLWMQSFYVVFYCRMMHTLACGEVASKKAGAQWARSQLDPHWRGLIDRAEASWQLPMDVKLGPADRDEVAATLDFIRYAIALHGLDESEH